LAVNLGETDPTFLDGDADHHRHREAFMFTDKEKKVKELIDEHMEKVGDCLGCFIGCFEAFLVEDKTKAEAIHENCDYAETEADILRRKIGDHLYSGAFLPIERKDIYILSEYVDKIANKAETASDIVVYQNPDVPNAYKEAFRKIIKTLDKMFRFLQEAVRLFSLEETLESHEILTEIREHISAVGVMESEIDREEEALMRAIFSSELPLSQKMQIERFLRRIAEVSDVIEDAADRLHILVIGENI
jgi:predicted phosphate transport protein (TIGR00153 family)